MPIQHESFTANAQTDIDFNFEIGFDDFDAIEPLSFSDAEVMGYKSKKMFS